MLDLDSSLDALHDKLSPRRRVTLSTLRAVPPIVKLVIPAFARMKLGRLNSLIEVVIENARVAPNDLAVEMDDEQLSWAALDAATSRLAHYLHGRGIKKGDVVALLGANSPSYLVTMLGASRVGATAALINNNVTGAPLDHAIRVSKANFLIVEEEYRERVEGREAVREVIKTTVTYGSPESELERALAEQPSTPFTPAPTTADEDFVYIYTSGTTGFPKPSRVSHERTLSAGGGFHALMLRFRPGDKLYNVLPLYHASALLIGVGSCFITRTPIALRRHFSASAFFDDVRRYDATAVLYIGELCRYLVNSYPEGDRNHRLRVAIGNGLRPDIWEDFRDKFDIPEIREFYAATEAPGFIFNTTGHPGSVGRLPPDWMKWMRLVRFDVDREDYIRDENGFCMTAPQGEVGELIVRLPTRFKTAATEFRGYTDEESTKKKIITDVFKKGDRYFRSGDLLRVDEDGFAYFVDRIGDTFRCKGENVSTAEVADVLGAAEGIEEVTVIGVRVPPHDGQFGLAAVVPSDEFDPVAFFRAAQELPSYAQPRFVRVLRSLTKTGTFKIQKNDLRRDGIDPNAPSGELYFLGEDRYIPFDEKLRSKVESGEARL